MKSRSSSDVWFSSTLLSLGMLFLASIRATAANGASAEIKVPIIMEEATVRGKVAVLESAREERKVISGLKVEVYSTKVAETQEKHRWGKQPTTTQLEKNKLLHETQTDDLGLFDLPLLDVGDYLLHVSQVQFRLTVISQSAERAGQSEPKVLLILIPKEVVSLRSEEKPKEPAP